MIEIGLWLIPGGPGSLSAHACIAIVPTPAVTNLKGVSRKRHQRTSNTPKIRIMVHLTSRNARLGKEYTTPFTYSNPVDHECRLPGNVTWDSETPLVSHFSVSERSEAPSIRVET